MKDRQPGYYWIKHIFDSQWQPAHWDGVLEQTWTLLGTDERLSVRAIKEVGPEILPPD